ncbi:MAG: hypothetical protein ACLU3P_00035 [[Eubacterium] siraeum]
MNGKSDRLIPTVPILFVLLSIIVNYYYLLSEGSIDEVIHNRLIEKETRLRDIIESMPIPLFENVGLETGDDDIKALIAEYVNRTKKM